MGRLPVYIDNMLHVCACVWNVVKHRYGMVEVTQKKTHTLYAHIYIEHE